MSIRRGESVTEILRSAIQRPYRLGGQGIQNFGIGLTYNDTRKQDRQNSKNKLEWKHE